VSQVEIVSEQELPRGWTFHAQVLAQDGTLRRHRLTLSWADYNHWSSGGSDAPADVAGAAMSFLASRADPHALPESIDASTIRRQHAGADEAIRAMLK
jgi:hypothetical protein